MKERSEYAFSTFPYPGLRPFNHDEADIFFGREKQVNRVLAKLGASRFLAVVGPSGCGKSSLIRAGLIPNLEAGFIVGTGSGWRIAEMRSGDHPLLALAKALLKPEAMGSDWNTEADAAPFLAAELRRGPLALAELLRKKPLPAGTNLLVLVDQFEEIFRMEGRLDLDEGNKFVDLLLETLRAASSAKAPSIGSELPVYLILTMRSDFLGDCALFRGLPEAINENLYPAPRLIRDETETAIVGPARVCGGSIDPVLVNRLLNEIGPDPDQLPVLQHALMRMWHHMLQDLPNDAAADTAEKIVTPDDYREIGETLGSSLDSHAKEVFRENARPGTKTHCGKNVPLPHGTGDVTTRSADARGRWLATVGIDKKAKLWDIATIEKSKPMAEFAHPHEVTDVSFSPGGEWLATLSDAVRLWDPLGKCGQSPRKFSLWKEDEKPWSLAFDPTGKLLAQTNKNGTVRLWDLGKWDVKDSDAPDTWDTLGGHVSEVNQGAFDPGGRLYASVGKDAMVRLWDLQRQHPLAGTMEPPGPSTVWLSATAWTVVCGTR